MHSIFEVAAAPLRRGLVLAAGTVDVEHHGFVCPTVVMYVDCEEDEMAIVILFFLPDTGWKNVPDICDV
jgi:hypothetical protein